MTRWPRTSCPSCCWSPSPPTGKLVLTGVVQEKSSRVVEVLLARMPARTLLAGKVTGIGLIGLPSSP